MSAVVPSSTRMVGWVGAMALGAAVTGVQWLLQPVEIPLFGILILTFVPLESTVTLLKSWMTRIEPQGQRDG